jgi:hypothetical protein
LLAVFKAGVPEAADVCEVADDPAVVLVVPDDFEPPEDPHAARASTAAATAAPGTIRVLITSPFLLVGPRLGR